MIWHFRLTFWICSSSSLTMRILKMSSGITLYGATSALIISKLRSGISLSSPGRRGHVLGIRRAYLYRDRPLPHACKELSNRIPDLLASAQTFPFEPDQTDQLVTGIYGDDVMLTIVLTIPLILHPVDKERLDIRLQLVQDRITANKLTPTLQAEHGLHSSRRAGIESHDAVSNCAVKYVDHILRYHQVFPLLIRHLEIRQQQKARG